MKMALQLKEEDDFKKAMDGQQALDIVKSFGLENPFTFILMDLTMPVMDGFQSSKLITEYCHKHKMKVIPTIYALTAS